MATSDSPLSVPNVTLAVARGSAIGGSSGFSWSANSGLSDGNEITVTTDGSGGFDFGLQDFSFASIGFGLGVLHSAAIDSLLNSSVIDPLSEEAISVEVLAGRYVKEVDGRRALYSLLRPTGATGTDIGPGCLSWDTGSNFADRERGFISSVAKFNAAGGFGSDRQTKTFRYRNEIFVSGAAANSVYSGLSGVGTNGLGGTPILQPSANIGSPKMFGGPLATFGEGWVVEESYYQSGDPDVANGYTLHRAVNPSAGTGIREGFADFSDGTTADSYTNAVSSSAERVRYLTIQDYCKDLESVECVRTDILMQRGSWKRFELADGPTPAESTVTAKLLPKSWASGRVKLHLWAGLAGDYVGKYIHFYDGNDTFVAGVAL